MKRISILLLLITLSSCGITYQINKTKSVYSQKCDGVIGLSWQKEVIGADAVTVTRIVTELTLAAQLDAERSESLKESLHAGLASELAEVINENVYSSYRVSEEFWEQEVRFIESLCLFLALLDRNDLRKKQKKLILNDIRKLVSAHNEYILNKRDCDMNPTELIKFDFIFLSPLSIFKEEEITHHRFTLPLNDARKIEQLLKTVDGFFEYVPSDLSAEEYLLKSTAFRTTDEIKLLSNSSEKEVLKNCNDGILFIPNSLIKHYGGDHIAFTIVYSQIPKH